MKIAYVTTYDSTDIRMWSGSGAHIAQALEKQGNEIIRVGSFPEYSDAWIFLKRVFYRIFARGGYKTDRDTRVLQALGKAVSERLDQLDFDVVLSPGTLPVAYLKTTKPVVFWTDATFAGLVDFYAYMSNLSAETLRSGHAAEQAALSNCSAAIYTSDWARETALQNYQVKPERTHVVPFGANIECQRTSEDIAEIVAHRSSSVCHLLFCGVDWERKGGDDAVKVAQLLTERGLPTELTILGCKPPYPVPDFVKTKGFISKETTEGLRVIHGLFESAHFLIFPTRADCLAVVGAEANSFGVPALTSDVGGCPTLINRGRNGFSYPLDHYVPEAAATIERYWKNPSDYEELARTSFAEYQARLNWDIAGRSVDGILHDVVARKQS